VVPELNGKLLELLKETVPGVTRMAVLVSPYHSALGHMLEEATLAAASASSRPSSRAAERVCCPPSHRTSPEGGVLLAFVYAPHPGSWPPIEVFAHTRTRNCP
jgi:hypothetical protein